MLGPLVPFTGSPDAAARPVEPAIRFTHTIGDRGKAKMSCLPAPQPLLSDIRRATRKRHSAEEKIAIVLAGLRGEDSIAELCRREGIAQSLYYSWSKEFLEAGKKRRKRDGAALCGEA